jgi:hypothetical protein
MEVDPSLIQEHVMNWLFEGRTATVTGRKEILGCSSGCGRSWVAVTDAKG